ncbi:MAG: hypothetical protein MUF34_34415 [Polyangiaceae bacterium]|jgi:hypothetical protein|nr:hypothetical protein [Polyangiaceae bacterium]
MRISDLNPSLRLQAMMNEHYDQGAEDAELDVRAAEQDIEEAQRQIDEAKARQLAAEQEAARAGFWEKTFDKVADVSKAVGTLNAATGGMLTKSALGPLGVSPLAVTCAASAAALVATGASAVKKAEKAEHEYQADLANVDQQGLRNDQSASEANKSRAFDEIAADADARRTVAEQAQEMTAQEKAHRQAVINNLVGA